MQEKKHKQGTRGHIINGMEMLEVQQEGCVARQERVRTRATEDEMRKVKKEYL